MIAIILAFFVLIGSVTSGFDVIFKIYEKITNREVIDKENYQLKEIGIGKSAEYFKKLLGDPKYSAKKSESLFIDGYDLNSCYIAIIFADNQIVAYFIVSKNSKRLIDLNYDLFNKPLGKILYNDIGIGITKIKLEHPHGDMGYAYYLEYYGTGRWGYYNTYVFGEFTLMPPIKSNEHNIISSAESDELLYINSPEYGSATDFIFKMD